MAIIGNFSLGALESIFDPRNKNIKDFGLTGDPNASKLENFTISKHPILTSQQKYGQCVAFSLAKIREIQQYHETGVYERLSTSYIYLFRDLMYEGEGMMPHQALKQMVRYGVCRNHIFPDLYHYTSKDVIKDKLPHLLVDAYGRKIKGYAKLQNHVDVATYLVKKDTPVLAVIEIGPSFTNRDTKTNIVNDSKFGDKITGLHAVIITGFKTINGVKYYEVQNSWGTNWGNKGYFYIRVGSNLIREMWAVMDSSPLLDEAAAVDLNLSVNSLECTVDGKKNTLSNVVKKIDNTLYLPLEVVTRFMGYTKESDSPITLKRGGEYKSIK